MILLNILEVVQTKYFHSNKRKYLFVLKYIGRTILFKHLFKNFHRKKNYFLKIEIFCKDNCNYVFTRVKHIKKVALNYWVFPWELISIMYDIDNDMCRQWALFFNKPKNSKYFKKCVQLIFNDFLEFSLRVCNLR